MTEHKCELCGTPVKIVGHTTLQYEPIISAASVPSVEEIENILMKQELRSANVVAKEIHALFTQGKENTGRGR